MADVSTILVIEMLYIIMRVLCFHQIASYRYELIEDKVVATWNIIDLFNSVYNLTCGVQFVADKN